MPRWRLAGNRAVGPGDFDGGDDTRGVIVGLVGVADVGHDEHLASLGVFPAARVDDGLGHFESARSRVGQKLGTDHNPVVLVPRQRVKLVFAQAEAPRAVVVFKLPKP